MGSLDGQSFDLVASGFQKRLQTEDSSKCSQVWPVCRAKETRPCLSRLHLFAPLRPKWLGRSAARFLPLSLAHRQVPRKGKAKTFTFAACGLCHPVASIVIGSCTVAMALSAPSLVDSIRMALSNSNSRRLFVS